MVELGDLSRSQVLSARLIRYFGKAAGVNVLRRNNECGRYKDLTVK